MPAEIIVAKNRDDKPYSVDVDGYKVHFATRGSRATKDKKPHSFTAGDLTMPYSVLYKRVSGEAKWRRWRGGDDARKIKAEDKDDYYKAIKALKKAGLAIEKNNRAARNKKVSSKKRADAQEKLKCHTKTETRYGVDIPMKLGKKNRCALDYAAVDGKECTPAGGKKKIGDKEIKYVLNKKGKCVIHRDTFNKIKKEFRESGAEFEDLTTKLRKVTKELEEETAPSKKKILRARRSRIKKKLSDIEKEQKQMKEVVKAAANVTVSQLK